MQTVSESLTLLWEALFLQPQPFAAIVTPQQRFPAAVLTDRSTAFLGQHAKQGSPYGQPQTPLRIET